MAMTKFFLAFLLISFVQFQSFATPHSELPSDEPCKYYIDELIKYAKKFRGIRYRSGGSKPSGFDCSGFVSYVYKKFDISLERSSRDMFTKGLTVDIHKCLPGDLIFFSRSSKSGSTISHVGIVIKSENEQLKFIHSSTRNGVLISDLSEKYYTTRFKGIRRMNAIVDNFHFPYYNSFLKEEETKN